MRKARVTELRVRGPEPEKVTESDQFGDVVDDKYPEPVVEGESPFQRCVVRLLKWLIGLGVVAVVLLLVKR